MFLHSSMSNCFIFTDMWPFKLFDKQNLALRKICSLYLFKVTITTFADLCNKTGSTQTSVLWQQHGPNNCDGKNLQNYWKRYWAEEFLTCFFLATGFFNFTNKTVYNCMSRIVKVKVCSHVTKFSQIFPISNFGPLLCCIRE